MDFDSFLGRNGWIGPEMQCAFQASRGNRRVRLPGVSPDVGIPLTNVRAGDKKCHTGVVVTTYKQKEYDTAAFP